MDARNSLDSESVKDELRLLIKSDQYYSKIKSAVLPETVSVTALYNLTEVFPLSYSFKVKNYCKLKV